MRRTGILVSTLVLLASLLLPLGAQERPPDTGKMSWDLYQLVMAGRRKRAAGQEVPELKVLLTAREPLKEEDLEELKEKGYTVLAAYGHFVLVEAPMDYFAEEEVGINTLEFVRNASLPPEQILSDTLTNGTAIIRAEVMWAQGYYGEGIKVAVIDEGFTPTHPRLSGMDPAPIYYLVVPMPFLNTYVPREGEVATESRHGTSCAIIVHDVAPKAQLYLISYPHFFGPIGWLCALEFAVRELKVDVVTSSVEFSRPTCHADGTGPLNEKVSEILLGSDTLFFLAAGNWAMGSGADRSHYHATFTDTDGDGRHDFTQTDDPWDRNTLLFEAEEGDQIYVFIEWDEWRVDRAARDLDLYLYDAEYRIVLAHSLATQYGKDVEPVEFITLTLPYSGRYAIVIEDAAAEYYGGSSEGVSFHLYLFNRSGPFPFIEHHTPCLSVREVATNPDVIAVGAFSPEDGTVRPYSSRGPTCTGLPKPEIFAPDGVTGTAYEYFYGTSAAAPYAASAAALLIQANDGSLTKEEFLANCCTRDGKDECGNPICKLRLPGIL